MKIAELFAYIGVVTDEQKLKDFTNLLNEGKNSLLNIAATATGTSIAFGAMFDKALNTALALSHFEAQTGLSAQTLQLWQHVGESVGVTADTVTGSIVALNTQLAAVRYGGGNASAFVKMGVNVGQDAWGVLKQLREIKASGAYSPQDFSYWIGRIGLSTEMVKLLQLSNKEFDKLSNRESIITPREMESLLKFNAALRETGENITKVFTQLSAQFAPSMEETLKGFNKWFNDNRGNMTKTIEDIGSWTKKIAGETKGAIDEINRIANATGGWNAAVVALVGSLALLHPEFVILTLIIDALNELNNFTVGKGSWQDKLHNFMSGKGGLISKGFGLGTNLGEGWLGDQVFGLGNAIKSWQGREPGMNLTPYSFAPQPAGGITITQYITGSGDPKETGDIAAKAIEKVINNAAGKI